MRSIKYLTDEETAKLAKSVWYAKWPKASKCNDNEKTAMMPAFNINGMSTEFPMRNGEWKVFGKYEMMIEYPMWDIPGRIRVRKVKAA